MEALIATFVPIFIAVDVIGIIPTFMSITNDTSKLTKNKIVVQASVTALAIGILFIVLGKNLFNLLGIGIPDFQVAGGILLFLFAVNDLSSSTTAERRNIADPHVGVVPIGMPLIAGPGVLTTLLLLDAKYGSTVTIASLFLNIVIVFFVFRFSDYVLKLTGRAGAIAIGKIFSIFLGAIGIMMIRKGVSAIILGM